MAVDKNLIVIGIAAAAGWYLYKTMVEVPAGVPSTASWNGYRNTGGGTRTTPKVGDTWLDSNNLAVAIFTVANRWALVPASQPITSAPSSPTPPVNPVTPPPSTPPAATPRTLKQAIIDAVNNSGVSSTFIYGQQSPDTWNWYAMNQIAGWTAPSPEDMFPGVPNAHSPLTFDAWWQKIQPFLPSGVSGMAGLGRSRYYESLYGGWMA